MKRKQRDRLVVLSGANVAVLPDNAVTAIDALDWYETPGHIILIPYSDAHGIETNPRDYGIDPLTVSLTKIDHCLHRWSEADGFYHV